MAVPAAVEVRDVGKAFRLPHHNRNTLKEHFRQLVEKGYLAKQGGGRSTWYVLT